MESTATRDDLACSGNRTQLGKCQGRGARRHRHRAARDRQTPGPRDGSRRTQLPTSALLHAGEALRQQAAGL